MAQALYDTAVQHFPEIVDWLNENIVQPLNDFADILDQHLDNLIHSTLDYFSDLRLPFKSALSQINIDPLVLDLDGDGVELISLASSNAHLDYGGDGFAERTGWVKADDGILVFDRNANGTVDGIGEMFGSATQDGFEVLETLDTNADGKIDAADADFASLRVWQDANEDGISDAGELKTLAELGIASVSVNRTDVTGTNEGHDRGFAAAFTKTDGSTGAAETIYFQTDRADTVDPTPGFTPAEGVDKLPQLPGSGNIFSIAYTLTNDAGFRADWTALADNAAGMSEDEIRSAFSELLLRWAGVDEVDRASRGEFVDARHLAFVEAFFGDTYREFVDADFVATSPARKSTGAAIEASFWQIVTVLELAFLAQVSQSAVARATDLEATLVDQLSSPYFAMSLLDFRAEIPEGETPPETAGNVGMVVDLIKALAPAEIGAQADYIVDAHVQQIAPAIANGTARRLATTIWRRQHKHVNRCRTDKPSTDRHPRSRTAASLQRCSDAAMQRCSDAWPTILALESITALVPDRNNGRLCTVEGASDEKSRRPERWREGAGRMPVALRGGERELCRPARLAGRQRGRHLGCRRAEDACGAGPDASPDACERTKATSRWWGSEGPGASGPYALPLPRQSRLSA